MKTTAKLIALTLFSLVSAFTVASCTSEKAASDIDAVKKAGKLTVGITEYEPMDYRDENGNWTGFDAEFAEMFADKLGVDCNFVVIDWDNKLLELSSGAIDCIWNGMSITDERISGMDLSTPYIANKQIIIVKSDSGISTKADLAGKTVGAQQGSSAVDAISAEPDVKASFGSLNEYASNDEAFLDLKAGRIDVLVVVRHCRRKETRGNGFSNDIIGHRCAEQGTRLHRFPVFNHDIARAPARAFAELSRDGQEQGAPRHYSGIRVRHARNAADAPAVLLLFRTAVHPRYR